MNVLIVDDQYENRYMLTTLLKGNGFAVFEAENGVEAVDMVQNNPLDLIISDILLPRMDGFSFCKEIKGNPEFQKIPFVFYSAAYTDIKDQQFAMSLGADLFIVKPTDPIEFISIIQELLSQIPSHEVPDFDKPLSEMDFLSEHNRRLLSQLEKKLDELQEANNALTLSERRYWDLVEEVNPD